MVSNAENAEPMVPPGKVCGYTPKHFIAKISRRHIIRIGKLIGHLIYFLDVPHRRIVRRNLAFAYPEWSHGHIKRISQRTFQNMGITFLEIIQLTALSREDILKSVRVVGLENLQRAQQSKKGLIIVSGHLGSWELGLLYVCCILEKPSLGVAKKIRLDNHYL